MGWNACVVRNGGVVFDNARYAIAAAAAAAAAAYTSSINLTAT
jgi:hypothetical protein